MPQYMVLLYAEESEERLRADMPLWLELTEGLREAACW